MQKNRILFIGIVFILFLLILNPLNQNVLVTSKIAYSLTIQNYNDYGISIEMPLEKVISRRLSVRNYDLDTTVPSELVLKVLWAAYGYSWRGRNVPSFSGYPIVIYVSNETATYRYIPETQSLSLWKEGDHRSLGGGLDAPIQLYIVLDRTICSSMHWGNAEAGCVIQNIYLIANTLNLGTVCMYRRNDIPEGLNLPANENALYKMPLGYPLPPYANYQNLVPTFRQSSPELPEIRDSNVTYEDALNSVFPSRKWSENPVTQQELSQVLWASYGYSYYEDTAESPPKRHRTVPSSGANYPMKIYAANSSGVYEYISEQHTLTKINTGDRRSSIAQAGGNSWASSAPVIITVAYVENSSAQYYIGGDETYVEVGLITQNVFLESLAWGLTADWAKTDVNEAAMRQALGLAEETTLHPLSIIALGHPSKYLHKAEWKETIYPIETQTNLTISNWAFDQPSKKISFEVSGPPNNFGFCNVTIPNSLLWGDFTVLINGNPQTTLIQINNSTHTSLYFTYELLGSLNIQIISEYVIPEFQTWTSILILMILMFIIIIYKRKNSKNS
jgi:SagB-type dehydrogenase family enzyme